MMPSVYKSDVADTVYTFIEDGSIAGGMAAYNYLSVHPVVYLKSSIKITSGTGSSSNPYQLSID